MPKLILIRHGESVWNLENRFTGWIDVDLTPKGIQQAIDAGQQLQNLGICFDLAYTSVLKRAIRTLWHIQDCMDLMWIPVVHSWRLNERHYGALSGLNKAKVALQHSDEQVLRWRRSYAVSPPVQSSADQQVMRANPRYAKLKAAEIPATESLHDTVQRVLPLWRESIAPALRLNKTVAIVAHGNSIRALVKHLEGISDEAIDKVNIANGLPLIYELDAQLQPINFKFVISDESFILNMPAS